MGLLDNMMTNPLAMASLGLLSMPTRSREPLNPIQFAMQGAMGAQRMKQMQTQQGMQAEQFKMQQDEYTRKLAQQKRLDELIAQLPPEQQQIAQLDPEGFAAARAKQMFAQTEPKTLTVNGRVVQIGPEGAKEIYAAPEQPTSLQKDYEVAKSQGFKGTMLDFDVQRRRSGATTVNVGGGIKVPSGYMLGPDGQSVVKIPGMEPTEGQAAAGNYANRMQEAGSRVADVEKRPGFDPTNLQQNAATQIPVFGNFALSSDFQEYQQAKEDWVRAKLRKESGAVIAREEMQKEMETYFPMPGDKPEVIARKREARRIAEQGMANQAGSAAPSSAPVRRYNPETGTIE